MSSDKGGTSFAHEVYSHIRKRFPSRQIEISGPMTLILDGRVLPLENLYRMVLQSADTPGEVIISYLDRVLCTEAAAVGVMPFALARRRVMPRIQPESLLEELGREHVAHIPFVNDTVIVFVVDLPDMTVTLSTEQLIRWKIEPEELEEVAKANLSSFTTEIEARLVESSEGGRAAVLTTKDGYDASRLLLDGLYERLSPKLGCDFLVATPARDVFVAMTQAPHQFVQRVQERAERDFMTMPYPITDRLFIVTRDGVAGTLRAA